MFCGTPPLAFTFGLGGLLCFPLRIGRCAVLSESSRPTACWPMIQDFRATIVFTAPTFYRQMAGLVGTLRPAFAAKKSVSAGEALPDATRQLWKQATGIEMIDGIGGTGDDPRVRVQPARARAARRHRQGGAGLHGPGGGRRHESRAQRHSPASWPSRAPPAAATWPIERQRKFVVGGWNLPGDTFVRDDDGYFFYQARNDDMIISAGYNIAGPEVEDALLRYAVAECGVVGVPDDERGTGGEGLRGAQARLRGLAPAGRGDAGVREVEHRRPTRYPREIEFVEVLPRTETGKLQRCRSCARWRGSTEHGHGDAGCPARPTSAERKSGSAIATRRASCSYPPISR